MSLLDFISDKGGEGRLWQYVQDYIAEWRKEDPKSLESLSTEELRHIVDILEKRIGERTGMLRVLYDVSKTAAESETVHEALNRILIRLSKHNGWCGGFVFLPSRINPSILIPAKAYYENEPSRFQKVRDALGGKRFAPGDGIPGRVLETGKPEWITDIQNNYQDQRKDILIELGMRTVTAFPILADDAVVGVLEFFSEKAIERDQHVIDSMSSVGVHVGLFIERRRMERLVNDLAKRERVRIGQDLHDHLSQVLSGATMIAKGIERNMRQTNNDQLNAISELNEVLKTALTQMRHLSKGLLLTDLKSEGLEAALNNLANDERERSRANITVEHADTLEVSDTETAEQLYHIAHEAVTNASKHADATNITIRLYEDDDYVFLEILDDGNGFPKKADRKPGLGLGIMRYRARSIGGRLQVVKQEPKGTLIRCTIPRNALAEVQED